jgi:hypothetical protein
MAAAQRKNIVYMNRIRSPDPTRSTSSVHYHTASIYCEGKFINVYLCYLHKT